MIHSRLNIYLLFGFLLLCTKTFISCTHSESPKGEWCRAITKFIEKHRELAFSNPDSLRLILSSFPIEPNDSLNWYYRETYYARCYVYKGETDSVLFYTDRVEAFRKRAPKSPALSSLAASNLNVKAVILQEHNLRDSALACLKLAYNEAVQADISKDMPSICINIADISRQLGKLPQAAEWYRRALRVSDSLKISNQTHSILAGLGLVYSDMQNFSLAHHYFSEAEFRYPPQNIYEKYYLYNSMGNVYASEEKHQKALDCFKKAYKSTKYIQSPLYTAVVEANMGGELMELDILDSAHYYIDKAYIYFCKDNTDSGIRFYVNGLRIALALKEHNLPLAHQYLSQPFNQAEITPLYMRDYYRQLMKYNARTGNYKKAYEYQQLTNRYSDSLRNVNYINNIADIDYRYKQDTALLKRNIIIANSHAKVSQLRNTATLSISLLVITIIAAASLYGYIRRRNKRKRAEQVAIITQLRMENIRNRFSPHFVFNVLNIVTGALQNGEQQILPLKLLIQVLRQNLLIADQMAIPLKDEIELVRNYLELRRSINSRMPSVNWGSDPEIDMNSLLPAMIIQIPVENVIKHASADSVNIQIRSIETLYFEIIIEDDGMGYIPGVYSNTKNDTGTGLRILFRIIELLNVKNTYKMTMDIINLTSINPETHGTCVHIIIPYHYNFKV